MRRTGVRSWALVIAGSLVFGTVLTGCGGDGSSSATPQSSTAGSTGSVGTVGSAGMAGTAVLNPAAGGSSGISNQSASTTAPGSVGDNAGASSDAGTSSSDAAGQGEVAQGGPGTVTLSWLPPTQYSDGAPLTSLAGYTIYYGTASQSYSQSIKVSNPGLTNYVVDNLPAGTYYFAIAAYDSTGAQGEFSPEIAAAVN